MKYLKCLSENNEEFNFCKRYGNKFELECPQCGTLHTSENQGWVEEYHFTG